MLLKVPDVLTPDELQQARHLLATAPWTDGRASAGSQAALVKNNAQLPHACDAARALRPMVLAALDRQLAFFSACLPKRVLAPQFNRYGGGSNHYGNHVDSAIRYQPDNGQKVRTDLSCTLFLSEPQSYDGGELVIQDTPEPQRFKLPAGHLLLYPADRVHQVTPVTRGERLACFFWVESMVRSDAQRQLLFDLDTALLQLRAEHGENAATVALTGTYHNLLRMWADT